MKKSITPKKAQNSGMAGLWGWGDREVPKERGSGDVWGLGKPNT